MRVKEIIANLRLKLLSINDFSFLRQYQRQYTDKKMENLDADVKGKPIKSWRYESTRV